MIQRVSAPINIQKAGAKNLFWYAFWDGPKSDSAHCHETSLRAFILWIAGMIIDM